MSTVRLQEDTTSLDGVRGLTEALAGAFAEGVDLGPRGAQIRLVGQTLETMIEALQARIAELDAETAQRMPLDINALKLLAQAARDYVSDSSQ